MIRAPAEADAPARLDNEGPATTYLSVTVFPAVTGFRGTGEVPAARAGLLHARNPHAAHRLFQQSSKRAGVGPRRSFSLTGDYRVARAAYEGSS